MKKITLLLAIFAFSYASAQVTTGPISLAADYTVTIDITDTDVTVTWVNDENRFMGLGFDTTSMTSGKDVITYDATGLNDRRFLGVGVPPPADATQDWSLVTDEVSGGLRTVVATRGLTGTDADDFAFSPGLTNLDIVWSRGSSLTLMNHGQGNRGTTTIGFTLGVDGVLPQMVSLFPNPAKDIMTLSLQNFNLQEGTVTIYAVSGALVSSQVIDHKSAILNVADLSNGVYILKVTSESGESLTTKFVKE